VAPDELNCPAAEVVRHRGDQQVDMIRHERIGMHDTSVLRRPFLRPAKIGQVIAVAEESRSAEVAPLNDMRGNVRKLEARLSWHVDVPCLMLIEA
jgi:hypothetical protein